MVSPTGLFRRYMPRDFETELFPSVYITNGKILSVIPLVFFGFLIVGRQDWHKGKLLPHCHSKRACNRTLFARSPRDNITSQKQNVGSGGRAVIRIAYPIRVRESR
jgi:hypothetical protein